MNGKKGLNRIMSALLATTSMVGGADVSARSDRKRKVPGVANGVSQKLSSGSDLYKFLAVDGGSALGGGLLTAAGMHFFGNSKKEKIVKKVVERVVEKVVEKVPDLGTELVLGLVEDIGDFLLVFDNSKIGFGVNEFEDMTDEEGICYRAVLGLNFAPYGGVGEGEASKFLGGRKGMKMNVWLQYTKDGLRIICDYVCDDISDEVDADVGVSGNMGVRVKFGENKLPALDENCMKKALDNNTVLSRFCVGLVRERLLFLYLRNNKGYDERKIKLGSLAQICWAMWKVPEVERTYKVRILKELSPEEFMGALS